MKEVEKQSSHDMNLEQLNLERISIDDYRVIYVGPLCQRCQVLIKEIT